MRTEPTDKPHVRFAFEEIDFIREKIGYIGLVVYLVLLKWQRAGYISKSIPFLAKQSGLCETMVKRTLSKLAEINLLRKLPVANGEKGEYELLEISEISQIGASHEPRQKSKNKYSKRVASTSEDIFDSPGTEKGYSGFDTDNAADTRLAAIQPGRKRGT